MLKNTALFEVKIRLKRLSSLVYFLAFFSLAFLIVLVLGGANIKGVNASFGYSDKLYINSAAVLHELILIFGGIYGVLIIAPVFGQAVCRDFRCRMDQLIFSRPINLKSYLAGRYIGAAASCFLIFSGIGLGAYLAGASPWVQKELFAEHRPAAYLLPYLTAVIPNILIFGALFFSLAAWTKKMAPVYLSGAGLFVLYMASGIFFKDIDSKQLAAMLDPFGMQAKDYLIEYWSVDEKNTKPVTWSGAYLYNRLLWLLIGLLPLGWTLLRFRPDSQGLGLGFAWLRLWPFQRAERPQGRPSKQEQPQGRPDKQAPQARTGKQERPRGRPDKQRFDFFSQITSLARLALFELRQSFKNIYFLVIYLIGVLYIFSISGYIGKWYGAPVLPVTYQVLEIVGGNFGLFVFILTVYYAGELIWRERDLRIHLITDALPCPRWIPMLSKAFCLIALQIIFLGTVMACGILIQAFKGYFHFEPLLYLKYLFGIQFPGWLLTALLAFFIHAVCSHKYLGHFIAIAFFIGLDYFSGLTGLEHKMYLYGKHPGVTYSDMSGFGPFLKGFFWFQLYWLLFAGILTGLAYLLWPRGAERPLRLRLSEARRRLSRPVQAAFLFLILAFVSAGAFVYYNTNVLNDYKYYTKKERRRRKFLYEKRYKKFERARQPALVRARLNVDIFPYKRELKAGGELVYQNKSGGPIQEILLSRPFGSGIEFSMEWGRAGEAPKTDSDLKHIFVYKLKSPLQPGESMELKFQLAAAFPGFSASYRPNTDIVSNGAFFAMDKYLPRMGYNSSSELSGEKLRRKWGLEPKPRMPKIDDPHFLRRSALGLSRAEFDVTASSSADQTAIAPGRLQRTWVEGNRRYFHYKTKRPVWPVYRLMSGRYAVKKDKWKDVDIEIYHHPPHKKNLDRMIKAVKQGLEYFTREFSPYQHKQFRIIEFPRYRQYAIALPNTIPYSESIGFIADVRDSDPKSIDLPFYVTAHELAHQWWGHQVTPAFVQGSRAPTEALSQYAALMVMEKEYGPLKMRRFLKHELNKYLRGRGNERKQEQPLALTENQPYIHYHKGSLIMYALKDYAGEKALNAALRRFIQKTAYQEAPFTTAKELADTLKESLPRRLHSLIDDFFHHITFYENRALEAAAEKTAPGKYTVRLKASSKKFQAGGLGKLSELPIEGFPVDIGVQNRAGDFIYLKKHPVSPSGEYEIEITSAELAAGEAKYRPHKAGIDPLNKLIDRKPDDNHVRISF